MKMGWPANKGAIGKLVKAYVGKDERGNQFSRLYRIADENNVSFPDLIQYALTVQSYDWESNALSARRYRQMVLYLRKNPCKSKV